MNEQDPRLAEIGNYLLNSAHTKELTAKTCQNQILKAALMITTAIKKGGKLLLCGNGGSAADCQHVAAELVCRLTSAFERPAIAAIALTTDSSFLTAFSNDYGFEQVFSRQVRALGRPDDVLMGISTSGSSKNVLLAFDAAEELGIKTIALTGPCGVLGQRASVAVQVPSESILHIQETHLTIEHLICSLVERAVFPTKE